MVAVAAAVEVPDGLYVDRATDLVAAGFDLWVHDAARWLRHGDLVPARDRLRCQDAWALILRRPARVPLVDLACQLAGVDELTVWAWLWRRAVTAAGLG